ncbi:glycosyltransferase family 4 protein [bacterium]|nr:glycosyltransferase family 4 protein [bacterium]
MVTSGVPFVRGGNELLAETLVRQLARLGYRPHLITVPQNRFGRQFSAYAAAYLTDVRFDGCPEKIDQVISLKFPSFAVGHPAHVCWFNHRMREYYDLWPEFSRTLGMKNLLKESMRRKGLHVLDSHLLKRRVSKVFAQSENIQRRLLRFGDIPSEVLYPPATDLIVCPKVEYGDFILSPGRLVGLKRHDLFIRAFARLHDSGIRGVIAGTGPDERRLMALAEQLGLSDRVEFVGELDYEALSRYYGKCLAVFYGPFAEDFGLVTLEAGRCHKCVITCTDSGGPTELVVDGESGLLTEPDDDALADAINKLDSDRRLAKALGDVAHNTSLRYSWEETIRRLVVV